MLVGTGICRALSTFSSFAFGMAVLSNGVDSKRRRRISSQAGISAGRSVSSAFEGITPSFFCRAKISSRSFSQP